MAFPTVAVNLHTPSHAAVDGYLLFNDSTYGKFNTAKFGGVSYVDQVANVRTFSTSRGSSSQNDLLFHTQAGTATVELDNRARSYDPFTNADIVPKLPVQITAVWNATTYYLFTGEVSDWQLTYPGWAADGVAELSATDGTSRLVDVSVTTDRAASYPGDRITSLLGLAQWPLAARDIDAGQTYMPSSTQTTSAWSAIVEASDSEAGQTYIDGDGTFVFRDRTTLVSDARSTASQVTFGDGGGSEVPITQLAVVSDDLLLANDVQVTYDEAGSVVEVVDGRSQLVHGLKPVQLQIQAAFAQDAVRFAQLMLYLYKDPSIRVDSVTIKPARNPTLMWPHALGRKLGDRVTVAIQPPGPTSGEILLTSDGFNRANGAVGTTDAGGQLGPLTWVAQSGTWAINTNELQCSSAPGVLTLDVGSGDVDIQVTHVVSDVNGQAIILRYVDDNNYIAMLGDNTQCILQKREAGSNTSLIATFGALGTNTVMRVKALGDTIEVYLDGVLKGTATSSFQQTATVHGLRSQGTSQRFDDFSISRVVDRITRECFIRSITHQGGPADWTTTFGLVDATRWDNYFTFNTSTFGPSGTDVLWF